MRKKKTIHIYIKSINFTKVANCMYAQEIPFMEVDVNNRNGKVGFQILAKDLKKVKRVIAICE